MTASYRLQTERPHFNLIFLPKVSINPTNYGHFKKEESNDMAKFSRRALTILLTLISTGNGLSTTIATSATSPHTQTTSAI